MTDKNKTEGESPTAEHPAEHSELAAIEPGNVTPEQLEELKQRAAKADEHWDRMLRITAEFDNFRKRAAREKQEAIRYANEGLLEKLVPVLDNFEMALSAATASSNEAAESLKTGVNMIHQQLKTVLNDAGLEEINAGGQPFDPNFHEAVAQRETPDVPEGQVVQQLRKGYKLKERLVRPATVIVAKKASA